MSKMWEIVCLPWSNICKFLCCEEKNTSVLCRYILKLIMFKGKEILYIKVDSKKSEL